MSNITELLQNRDTKKRPKFPAKYQGSYEEFLRSPEPMKLVDELAQMRTIISIFRDEIQNALDEARANEQTNPTVLSIAMSSYLNRLGQWTEMLEAVSRVAKRSKEIEDGIIVKVDINMALLVRFVRSIVFRFVPDVETQRKISEAAKEFFDSTNTIGYNVAQSQMLERIKEEKHEGRDKS